MWRVRNLREEEIGAFVAFVFPGEEPQGHQLREARLRRKLEAGVLHLEDVFLLMDVGPGEVEGPWQASLGVALGEGSARLAPLLVAPGVELTELRAFDLVHAAVDRARQHRASEVTARPLAAELTTSYRRALQEEGFVCRGERVEFRTALENLPEAPAGRLRWRRLLPEGRQQAAQILARVSQGDPHGLAPGEDAQQALDGFLAEPGLTAGPECLEVGEEDGEVVALVLAQVEATTGWGRITYLGLVPEARGRGLGREVHLRGVTLLRAQGAVVYHGGTSARNAPMLALFRRNLCVEHARMTEWVLA